MALLSQFSTLLLLAVGASLGQCPPLEDILPCSCTIPEFTDVFNIKVLCSKVDDVDDVRRALQSVKQIQRVAVDFWYSRLGSVPSDLFKGLHVTQVSFFDCFLKRIGDEGRSALEGLEDIVKRLTVFYSFHFDNSLNFPNVSRLGSLNILTFTSNNMKEVGDAWFAEGPANLKELHFQRNWILRLGDSAFAQLTSVREMDLDHNRIHILKRSMFPSPAIHLWKISLNDNGISFLPVDMFSNMPAIKSILLDRNSIQRIPKATWSSVWSGLARLLLNANPLNCDVDIEWILKESPPYILEGYCVSPPEREGVDLKKIIDDNKETNYYLEY